MTHYDAIIIGSGFGSLSAASLLVNEGLKVVIMEQNYLPGGCTSSYWRKGFVFESGATTVVGVDEKMPLRHLLEETGVKLDYKQLEIPMSVTLNNGKMVTRYQPINDWIEEASRIFGQKEAQQKFWKKCFEISQFVWDNSLKQKHFPPSNLKDLKNTIKSFDLKQIKYAKYAFMTMDKMLKNYGLDKNELFKDFINEQLLITAQNYLQEVNILFGAAALCYTNYTNCYIDGGLINLVNPFIDHIKENNGKLILRNPVRKIVRKKDIYSVETKNGNFTCEYLISGIPINNTLAIFSLPKRKKISKKIMHSNQLNSAFQMGIGFKSNRTFDTIHHQVHLKDPLIEIGSKSIFISFNHPEDTGRCDESGCRVISVSTHISNPEKNFFKKEKVEEEIINILEERGILEKSEIIYKHSSTQKSWEKWTGRINGFVGGYPQFKRIKPWQMIGSRLDNHKAYLCGDTSYPGQGIPGVALSGIIAYEKLKQDWL